MKISELVKDGWPERKEELRGFDICQKTQFRILGHNACFAAIEPIKNAEVRVDEKVLFEFIDYQTSVREKLTPLEKANLVCALAVNLDKFLTVTSTKEK